MKKHYNILIFRLPTIFFTVLLILNSCKHDPPEIIPPPVGKLTEDFFLQGNYILRYSVSGGSFTYLPSDSMYLRIGPVHNGISIMKWVRGSVVLKEKVIADISINPAFVNAYLWPFPPRTEIELLDINGNNTVRMYCWPNYVNYGYTSDSIVYSGSAFDSVGDWFFWKE